MTFYHSTPCYCSECRASAETLNEVPALQAKVDRLQKRLAALESAAKEVVECWDRPLTDYESRMAPRITNLRIAMWAAYPEEEK